MHEEERGDHLFFEGNAIISLDGTLGETDYRGRAWSGRLVLPGGGGAEVECVFDRSKGEDFYNEFGNKRVSVTGRAIYRSDSLLPKRFEVFSIQRVPIADEFKDFNGILAGAESER